MHKVSKASEGARKDLNECLARTSGDKTICHRYGLYVDDAAKKEAAAAAKLADCLNAGLSVRLRQAVSTALPGHAAVSVETRADGTLILWTFAPTEQTAFALEVAADGQVTARTPLAANQVQWVREQLGL